MAAGQPPGKLSVRQRWPAPAPPRPPIRALAPLQLLPVRMANGDWRLRGARVVRCGFKGRGWGAAGEHFPAARARALSCLSRPTPALAAHTSPASSRACGRPVLALSRCRELHLHRTISACRARQACPSAPFDPFPLPTPDPSTTHHTLSPHRDSPTLFDRVRCSRRLARVSFSHTSPSPNEGLPTSRLHRAVETHSDPVAPETVHLSPSRPLATALRRISPHP
ncbi:hypothetical protein B0J12DRAFT_771094 [Macrophomina phaseolina]|uniref:Uncharacterized protein n=1 Tax=Macrophomina phaseolina TaxID=35725 RepID=A0ABQ8FX35_9PEZI|nr:hypothetical protein B0J12DRAFT_771094 [Macrophomina phaseolina]